MKIICVPMGSAGDVHPLVWLGRLMAGRGHEVVVVVQKMAAGMARQSGLRLVEAGDASEQEQVLKDPNIWDPRKAFYVLARWMPRFAAEMVPLIEREIVEGDTVILAGTLAFGAMLAGEKRGTPVIPVHLQPTVMMSAQDMPLMMARGEWMLGMPRWMKRAFFGLVKWQVGGVLGRPLEKMRHELGLPPRRLPRKHIIDAWWHSSHGELCLFPDWYAAKASDWPTSASVTRFPLYDETNALEPDPKLEQFLAGCNAADGHRPGPVVITPGSANAHAAMFLENAAHACARLNAKAILVTRFPEQVPAIVKQRPDLLAAFEYVPFGWLFPRAGAVVHHGGIGTTAQCLAAGVPQLVMPMSHDQPDNALRIKRFGVAEYLYPKQFSVEKIEAALRKLMRSTEVATACGAYRQKMREQMTADHMGNVVETMSRRSLEQRAGLG